MSSNQSGRREAVRSFTFGSEDGRIERKEVNEGARGKQARENNFFHIYN